MSEKQNKVQMENIAIKEIEDDCIVNNKDFHVYTQSLQSPNCTPRQADINMVIIGKWNR